MDATLIQWLNLLKSSPNFAIRIDEKSGQGKMASPKIVPANDGEYWLHGETCLKNGTTLTSVFRVQTNSGGTLLGTYWDVDGKWMDATDDACFDRLGLTKSDAMPYDWSYTIPLTEDIYHD